MQDKKMNVQQDLNTSFRPLLTGMLLAACVVIGGMVYTMQLGSQVSNTNSNLTLATEHIIRDVNVAHFWLEEALVNGNHETMAKVDRHLSLAREGFYKLQQLSNHSHTLLSDVEFETLPFLQQKAFHTFNQLAEATKTRLAHPLISLAGSSADQRQDALFNQFNTQMIDINTVLYVSLEKHMSHVKNIEIFIIFLSLIIMIVTTWVVLIFLKKQNKIFARLLHTERQQHTTEEKYRALVEQSPLSIQLMSPDGTILQVNKAWEELWGITSSTLHDYNIFQDPLIKASGINDMIVKGFAGESITAPVVNFNPNSISDANTPFTNCFVRTYIYPARNIEGDIEQVILRYEDVTASYLQHKFQLGQNQVLQLISDPSSSLPDVLKKLILFVEEQAPQMMGSILLLDESGRYIMDGAGPHLPDAYREAVDGIEIGPKVGSCGTAAYTGQRVIVSDINTDPLWKDFKDLALSFDLQACWSQPIKDSEGKVLGTFAMYYHTPHQPSAEDLKLIENTAQLASIAIAHKQSMDKVIISEA
ncbi:MAG: GAF domain-containing protein, partial [Ghiorsea sp.]|nr:GAF domain-containing protein [Ghiorsea sp.]